jgi:hypothetical protein
MARSRRRLAISSVIPLLGGLLLAGCGGSSGSSTGNQQAVTVPSTSMSANSPTRTTASNPASGDSSVQTAAVVTTSDSAGNKASLTISLGKIQPANQITDSLVQTCSSNIASLGSSLDRSLAIPISLSIKVTSSLPTTLGVSLVDQYLAVPAAPVSKVVSTPIFFAEGYSDGPQCASPSMNPTTAGQITWNNSPAGAPQTWRGYIIQANAITPNDPTGSASDLHKLLIDPVVSVGQSTINDGIHYDTANSPFEMLCQSFGGDNQPLVAIDPTAVTSKGCSPA